MILRTPFWIALAAVLGTAQVTGAINVFTTAATVLTGIDGAVHTALDFKEWAPQVKTYIKGKKNAVTSSRGVLLAPKPANIKTGRNGAANRQINSGSYRLSDSGNSISEKILPGIEFQ